MKFVLSCILSSYFYKHVLIAAARSTFLKTDAKQNASELTFHQKAILHIAFLMHVRIKIHR